MLIIVRVVAVVAGQAGYGAQCLGMAIPIGGAAVIDAASSFV